MEIHILVHIVIVIHNVFPARFGPHSGELQQSEV
jgi:hypothetical protein